MLCGSDSAWDGGGGRRSQVWAARKPRNRDALFRETGVACLPVIVLVPGPFPRLFGCFTVNFSNTSTNSNFSYYFELLLNSLCAFLWVSYYFDRFVHRNLLPRSLRRTPGELNLDLHRVFSPLLGRSYGRSYMSNTCRPLRGA